MKIIAFLLVLIISFQSILIINAQTTTNTSFDKTEIVIPNGNSGKKIKVNVTFQDDEIQIKSKKDGKILKTFKYSEIKVAEYSFTESPRWKEGIGLTAATILFPLAWFVTIPLGFTKTKHHWLTFRSEKDFAVLQLNKRIRKLFIPVFETKTGLTVEGKGAEK